MAKRKVRDPLPMTVLDTICVQGGCLGDKYVNVPFEAAQTGDVGVRFFRIRKRDHWMLGPVLPAQQTKSRMASEIIVKVQQKLQTAILSHRMIKRSKDAEEKAGEATRGRDIVGLSQETASDSSDDVVVELDKESRTSPYQVP